MIIVRPGSHAGAFCSEYPTKGRAAASRPYQKWDIRAEKRGGFCLLWQGRVARALLRPGSAPARGSGQRQQGERFFAPTGMGAVLQGRIPFWPLVEQRSPPFAQGYGGQASGDFSTFFSIFAGRSKTTLATQASHKLRRGMGRFTKGKGEAYSLYVRVCPWWSNAVQRGFFNGLLVGLLRLLGLHCGPQPLVPGLEPFSGPAGQG